MREFNLLQHIFEANQTLGRDILVPPGDDMAMIKWGRQRLLAAVDQIIDGVHFQLETTPLELIGRKAITRNLSDIAAMAGYPVASLAAAALPPDFGEDRAKTLFDAMRTTAANYDCPLIGGDIAIHAEPSHPLTLAVTVLAGPSWRHVPERRGAKVGDGVYVTGPLGGSVEPNGLGRHLTFEPRLRLAREMIMQLSERLHSMIDISDGLGRDATHIAEMSNVQIVLHADRIPCNPGCDWRRALSDGEDYELCFTASEPVPHRILKTDMTRVGEVRPYSPDQPRVVVIEGAQQIDATELGWEHRSPAKLSQAP